MLCWMKCTEGSSERGPLGSGRLSIGYRYCNSTIITCTWLFTPLTWLIFVILIILHKQIFVRLIFAGQATHENCLSQGLLCLQYTKEKSFYITQFQVGMGLKKVQKQCMRWKNARGLSYMCVHVPKIHSSLLTFFHLVSCFCNFFRSICTWNRVLQKIFP